MLVDFYVMNGSSSQDLVLGYTFLAENDATINFKSREVRLGGMSLHCLRSQVEEPVQRSETARTHPGLLELDSKWGRCWA